MLKLLTAGLCAGTALVALQTSAPAAAPAVPYANPGKCPVSVKGSKLTCGTLVVAEDRSDAANKRQIRLTYVRIKARAAQPAADPVVFLTGGPGSSAIYFMNALAKSELVAKRDLIVIEQRGNGYSDPNLVCDAGEADTHESTERGVRSCYDQLVKRGVNLDAYNITQSAHDLADLKSALGIAEWNVLGTSFGSFWALRYADLHPQGVRTLVLDSPYPPQASPDDGEIAHLNGLSAIFTACRGDKACNAAYPKLRDRFVAMIQKYDREPLTTPNGLVAGRDIFMLVNGANFETTSALYVPRLIDAIERSDFATVQAIVSMDPYGRPRGIDMKRVESIGLKFTMQCASDIGLRSPSDFRFPLDEEWPPELLAAGKYSSFKSDACTTYWKAKLDDPAVAKPIQSNIPALIIVGALDPETPPVLGVEMARTFPNATLLVLPDAAHAALSSPNACTNGVLDAFLTAPGSRPDITCVARQLPRFSLSGDPISPTPAGR